MNEKCYAYSHSIRARGGAIAKFDVVVIDFGYDRNWSAKMVAWREKVKASHVHIHSTAAAQRIFSHHRFFRA